MFDGWFYDSYAAVGVQDRRADPSLPCTPNSRMVALVQEETRDMPALWPKTDFPLSCWLTARA